MTTPNIPFTSVFITKMENSDATHKRKLFHVHYSGRCVHDRILHFSASHNTAKSCNIFEDKNKINYKKNGNF